MSKRMPAGNSLDGWMAQIWAQARVRRGLARTVGALSAFAPALALANPTGGQVVAGSATIGNAGGNGVIVNQNSQRAAINWQQFSIGTNEYVQFNQPNSSSVVLNRVTGNNPSSIFGAIKANGQVFLINPNGILFAPGSTLDVSSLTASTLDISDSDFMAGRYVFARDAGSPAATVVNQGNISVTRGGYVVLAGNYVENDGVINAVSGRVVLAAGGAATLSLGNAGDLISYKIDAPTLARLAGVDNAGSIVADGGTVVMTADVANALTATAVNNSGLITAHSVSQQGGQIILLSQGGGIENSGTLDASATQAGVAGGMVIIRGDEHTQLTDTSQIDAEGDGAKGGFVELSGHTLGVRGSVTLGKGGSLLIDPTSIGIAAGGGSGHSGHSSTIGTSFIVNKLNAGDNVTIVASKKITNTTGTGITAHGGAGNLTMAIGTITGGTGCSAVGGFAACVGLGVTPAISHGASGGTIDLTGLPIDINGNLVIDAAANANANGKIITAALKAASITLTADKITVNGNLTTTVGDAILFGHSGNSDVTTVTGTVNAAGAFKASFSNEGGFGIGTVTLHNVTAEGIRVQATHINVTGTLHATGSAAAGASHRDVVLRAQHEFSSLTPAANISVGNVISDNGSVTMTASGHGTGITGITVGSITAVDNVSLNATHSSGAAVSVKVSGAISASNGGVSIKTQGNGGISVGSIIAHNLVSISAASTGGAHTGTLTIGDVSAGTIKMAGQKIATGNLTANNSAINAINVQATGSNSGVGYIHVTGNVIAPNGGVFMAVHGGSDLSITGKVTAGFSHATLSASNASGVAIVKVGGAVKGPEVNISAKSATSASVSVGGNITATAFDVNITASDIQTSSTQVAKITTGAITAAKNVRLTAVGGSQGGAKITTGSITAYTNTCGLSDCNGGSVHIAAANGSVDVGGAILVTMSAFDPGGVSVSGRAINVGNITAHGGDIDLTGNDIQVSGALTDLGGSVCLTGSSVASHAMDITVTGTIKAGMVQVNANPGTAATQSASIDLAKVTSSLTGGIMINAVTTANVRTQITVGSMHVSNGGHIDVTQEGASGGIAITGPITATNETVSLSVTGGNLSAGAITAKGILLTNEGVTGGGITVNGTLNASSAVSIQATNHSGANIKVTGNIFGSDRVTLHADAGSHSGGNIKVTGSISASVGAVQVTAKGGGESGGRIHLGGVSAAQDVTIDGTYTGNSPGFVVKVGSVTAEKISITVTGHDPLLSAATLRATGRSGHTCECGSGFLNAKLVPGASFSGSINITGTVKSTHGEVTLNAGQGTVTLANGATGKITAGTDITISGGTLHLGSLAAGSSLLLTASSTGRPDAIVVTGNVSATHVRMTAIGSGAGGDITVNGNIIVGTNTNSSAQHGVLLDATNAGVGGGKITVNGKIIASSGSIALQAHGGAAKVTGLMSASTGGVTVSATGGSISVAAITAHSGIDLSDTAALGGGITVNGNLNGASVSISAANHAGADVKVLGKIISGGKVNLNANAVTQSGGNIKVTGLISAGSSVSVRAVGGGAAGGRVQLGNVTAVGSISIGGNYAGTAAGFTMQLGNLTGKRVDVSMTGKAPTLTVGAITATGPSTHSSSHGFINVSLAPTNHTSGSMSITGAVKSTHGNITLSADEGVLQMGGSISAAQNVNLSGGRLHLGNITAGSHISISAFAVGNHAASISAPVTDLMTAKSVDITIFDSAGSKGGKIAIGGVTANGVGTASSSGKIKITASLPTEKVTVSTGTLTAKNSIAVQIQNASGSASLGKLNAPTVNVSIANGNLTVGQLVHASASLTASNGSITDTTAGSLNLVGDKFNTTHGVHLKAGTNIILTNDSFGSGGLSASAGGKLVETSSGIMDVSGQVLKAGGQLVLSAATIELGAAKLTASSIQLSATSINNASGNGTITAAKGTIHATQGIFLVNENIVVSGAGPLISAASVNIDNAVVTGTGVLSVTATGNLDASNLHVNAGGFTAHGGSVNLAGAKLTATKAIKISSVKDVTISGAQIAGSAVGISAGSNIVNGSGAGALAAGAGGLTLKAKSDIQLVGESLNITGAGLISAAGSLSLGGTKFTGVGTAVLHAGTDISLTGANLALSGLTLTAGGSIDLNNAIANVTGQMALQATRDITLTGATLTLGNVTMDAVAGSVDLTGLTATVTGQMGLQAKKDIILSGVHINTGIFTASASGTIHNGGAQGAITAAGMKFNAKKDIDLSDTVLTLGAGVVSGVTGDTQLLQLLATLGLKPGSAAPNGAFLAGGSLTLGTMNITGDYLVLQGSSISILGPVTAPTSGLLVEVRPVDPAASIGVEGQPASGATFNLSDKAFFSLFPGDTIVIGDDAETGSVQIGGNGPFTLAGGTNLLFDTTGTITGLSNITGSGLVGSLVTVAGNSGDNNVVTAGEIDPSTTTTSLGDQTDKKHLGHNGQPGGNGEGQNGIIGTDTDTSSVCH
ncbi:MAG: filamentous hemagglutinin N-terminal domain-containing protein [Gammaproteobacteria bacterium]